MSLRLCVLLWAVPGHEDELRGYEDQVLPLLADHRGRLLSRERVLRTAEDDPVEVQRIEIDDPEGVESYLADPRRLALDAERQASIRRTLMLRLE